MMKEQPTPDNLKPGGQPLGLNFAALDRVFDTLPSGLMLLDSLGNVLRMNQRSKTLLGLDAACRIDDIQALPTYLAPLKAKLSSCLASVPQDIQRAEMALEIPGNGNEISIIGYNLSWIEASGLSGIQLIHLDQSLLAFTFTNITQVLKDREAVDKIKDELHQSKKLASIGTMISGVAHELNNPLTGISMSAELSRMNIQRLLSQLQNPDQALNREDLLKKLELSLVEINKIGKSCQKAAVLVGDLLSYGKPSQLLASPIDLPALVDETIQILQRQPGFSGFEMGVQWPPQSQREQYWVLADRVKLEQVFYNLCKNAADAAQATGKLSVEFTLQQAPSAREGQPLVVAHVRDNGPGIEQTILKRIFDPFFSTKGNKGVGLGLSISYRTIEQHGGQLSVRSQAGEWTEFQVALPQAESE